MSICEAKNSYFDGRDAARQSQLRLRNPHPPGTEDHRQWDAGWRAGTLEVLNGTIPSRDAESQAEPPAAYHIDPRMREHITDLLQAGFFIEVIALMIEADNSELRKAMGGKPAAQAHTMICEHYKIDYNVLETWTTLAQKLAAIILRK